MVLSEVSGNAKPQHLVPYEQAQIVTLHDAGLSECQIQKFIDQKYSLKCSCATIHNTITLEPEQIQGHALNLGSEKKTTREQDQKLLELAMSNLIKNLSSWQLKLACLFVQCNNVSKSKAFKSGKKLKYRPQDPLTPLNVYGGRKIMSIGLFNSEMK